MSIVHVHEFFRVDVGEKPSEKIAENVSPRCSICTYFYPRYPWGCADVRSVEWNGRVIILMKNTGWSKKIVLCLCGQYSGLPTQLNSPNLAPFILLQPCAVANLHNDGWNQKGSFLPRLFPCRIVQVKLPSRSIQFKVIRSGNRGPNCIFSYVLQPSLPLVQANFLYRKSCR